jgi:hypothetical protein
MAGVKLPDYPKETEFEEFISAYLQCSGAFVERQIREREPTDVLELDIVLTYHQKNRLVTRIAEVKSGAWGCRDIFTLAGWMRYLGVEEAILASLGGEKDRDLVEAVATKLGIRLAWLGSHDDASQALKPFLEGRDADGLDVLLWRFAYWLERALEQRLGDLRKSSADRKGPAHLYDVHKTLQSNLFSLDMLTRTEGLYGVFAREPHLAARWGSEEMGADFDEDCDVVPGPVFERVYYHDKSTAHDLDLATWIEHRMRLTILKNLVDYELLRRSKGDAEFNKIVFHGLAGDCRLVDTLPASFQTALQTFAGQPHFHRYPVLWQWFLWVAGGFLLLDHLSDEYAWLGEKAGLPAAEVPQALQAYDVLFPTESGWFKDLSPNSHIRVLSMMPVPYQGIGANLRRFRYAPDQSYDALAVDGAYTKNDLVGWHNNLVHYLQRCR